MYTYKCTVLRVIDGDTIDVDIDLGFDVKLYKQRIRLHGIDTPESRTRDKEEKVRGLLSKNYLKDRAPVGSTILLESLDRGKFGRILGKIWEYGDSNWNEDHPLLAGIDEDSINKEMCLEGFAVEYYGGNKDELKPKHMANKEILIEKGLLKLEN
jgi:micrococcal nuclease